MSGTPSLFAGIGAQIFDNNGNPLAGGKIYTYLAGTTTPIAVYTTEAANVAHPNPIILDSAGRVPTGEIWLKEGDAQYYKFVVSNSADAVQNTYDYVPGTYNSQILNTFIADLAAPTGASLVGFIQTGTGAVATTVLEKAREWVSPHDFGAVGDANASGTVGTNDNAAFVLLEAEFTNTLVNLEGKIYLVNSPIPHANQYVNGEFVVAAATTDDQPTNFAIGQGAFLDNTFIPRQFPSSTLNFAAGNFNTAVGNNAMANNTTGRRNTAIGSQAMFTNTTGYYNVAVGSYAQFGMTTGDYNVAIGNQCQQFLTFGNSNVAVGNGTMVNMANGSDNTAVGDIALTAVTNRCVAIGKQAAASHTGNDSVAIGYQALSAPTSSGLYNVMIGNAAGGGLSTGDSNTGVGRRAMAATTTGTGNVALGNDAMVGAGVACTGSNNVAVGNTAAPNIQAGYQNVAIGASAGAAISDGFSNTFAGRFSGQATNTGSGNVAVGEQALTSNTTGNYNTAVGTGTLGGSNYDNTSMLGYQATVTGSNQVQLGNASTTTYAYGAVQDRSDVRDKTDVRDTVLGLDFINSLRPVDFKWDMRDDYRTAPPQPPEANASNEEKDAHRAALQKWSEDNQLSKLIANGSKARKRYHHGLIAQEVKAVIQNSGVDFGGFQDHSLNGGQDVMSLGYEELIAPLIKAVQELTIQVNQLKAKV